MEISEETIWDAISNSAKRRFDYQSFERLFRDAGDPAIAVNLLFKIILSLASGEARHVLELELNQDMALLGLSFDGAYLQALLEPKETELEKEMRATKLAHAMLGRGTPPFAVLVSVQNILVRVWEMAKLYFNVIVQGLSFL